jgi:hypothetical protein
VVVAKRSLRMVFVRCPIIFRFYRLGMTGQFRHLEFFTLIEMLDIFTGDYFRMKTQGGSQEKLNKYRQQIDELQLEINFRKTERYTSLGTLPINFTLNKA